MCTLGDGDEALPDYTCYCMNQEVRDIFHQGVERDGHCTTSQQVKASIRFLDLFCANGGDCRLCPKSNGSENGTEHRSLADIDGIDSDNLGPKALEFEAVLNRFHGRTDVDNFREPTPSGLSPSLITESANGAAIPEIQSVDFPTEPGPQIPDPASFPKAEPDNDKKARSPQIDDSVHEILLFKLQEYEKQYEPVLQMPVPSATTTDSTARCTITHLVIPRKSMLNPHYPVVKTYASTATATRTIDCHGCALETASFTREFGPGPVVHRPMETVTVEATTMTVPVCKSTEGARKQDGKPRRGEKKRKRQVTCLADPEDIDYWPGADVGPDGPGRGY